MCWKENPALASSADCGEQVKHTFLFIDCFHGAEVPIANSAAAELQKIAQPGYNPVAGCPTHPQSKIQ